MRSLSSALRGVLLVGAVGLALVTTSARAQGRWTITPSFTLSEEFTDNVFLTTSDRKSDFITQFTPGIGVAYEGPQLRLLASYSVTGEIYAEYSELNNFGDNQQALASASYQVDPRLTLRLAGLFARTNDQSTFLGVPATVPPGTTVVPTVTTDRQLTNTFSLTLGADYQFDARWSGTATYGFTAIDSEDGTDDGTSNTLSLGLGYQLTPADRLSLTANGGVVEGDETFSLLVGWQRRWTPDFTTDFAIGPRWTDGELGGAVNASLDYQLARELTVGLRYWLGTALAVGGGGDADTVSSLTASVGYRPLRDLQLSAFGNWTRSIPIGGSDGETEDAFGAGVSISYQLTRWLSASLSYAYTIDQGDEEGSTRENRVTLGLTASYPFRY